MFIIILALSELETESAAKLEALKAAHAEAHVQHSNIVGQMQQSMQKSMDHFTSVIATHEQLLAKELNSLSADVKEWMRAHGLQQLEEALVSGEFTTLDAIATMTSDTINGFAVPIGLRIRLQRAVNALQVGPTTRQPLSGISPPPLHQYASEESMLEWLQRHELQQLQDLLHSQGISTLSSLACLDRSTISSFAIPVGLRIRLQRAIQDLRQTHHIVAATPARGRRNCVTFAESQLATT